MTDGTMTDGTGFDGTADIAVVGAGVAGLAVAHDLARAGLSVKVFEASGDAGGLLRRGDLAGIPVDVGAESYATRTSAVADLVADAGLALQLADPAPGGAHLAARGDAGILRAPLPRRTVLGIPADPTAADVVRILGPHGAARVLAERDLPALGDVLRGTGTEPTLAELVAERCGQRLLDRLVDPLCRSVYSQPATALRLSRLHPALWHEALVRGTLVAAAAAVAGPARAGAAVGGIVGGMWQLPVHLRAAAEAHGAVVHTGVAVTSIVPGAAGVTVRTAAGDHRARRVVVATGASAGRALLGDPVAPPARVRVVVALLHAHALDSHPVGSGVVVAGDVPSTAKALTHVNAKWAWLDQRLPAGQHVVRMSARDAAAPGLDTPAQIAAQVSLLTGVAIAPADVVATCTAEYADAVAGAPPAAARTAELREVGIHQVGAAVAGAGLASVVPQARALARELAASAPDFEGESA